MTGMFGSIAAFGAGLAVFVPGVRIGRLGGSGGKVVRGIPRGAPSDGGPIEAAPGKAASRPAPSPH
jgi:hypothetical protein